MKRLFKKDCFWLIVIILFSLLAIYPLFKLGFYPFHDEPHIANLYEMIRAVSSHQIPPRWAPDFSYGYGYPFFIFYYPLPFYLGTIFHFLFRGSLIWSLKLVFLFSIPLSGISFYFLMKKYFSKSTAFAGSLVYMFTPYRAVDLYVRGAVGELWAFVFLPLVILNLMTLVEERTTKRIFFAGLSIGGLILAHNLTSVIFLPFAFLFVLYQGFSIQVLAKDKKINAFFSLLLGLLLGLLFSSFYWLPMVLEKKYLLSGTPFNPFDHFPFIKQLLLPSWGYGASVWGPGDGMSFQIGIINLLAVFIGLVVWLKRKISGKGKPLLVCSLICFFISVFLMNIRSGFLWKALPLGNYIQFPWRLLVVTTFFSSFLIGFSEKIVARRWVVLLPLILALFSIILTKNYFKPEKILYVDDNYYLKRFFANITTQGKISGVSDDYRNYSEDYLPLTIWTKERPSSLPKDKIVIPAGTIDYQELSPVNFLASIKVEKSTKASFNSYYYPGWKVLLDKKEVAIEPDSPFGNISFFVPAGIHQIAIKFVRTPERLFSEVISLSSLLILLLLVLFRSSFFNK